MLVPAPQRVHLPTWPRGTSQPCSSRRAAVAAMDTGSSRSVQKHSSSCAGTCERGGQGRGAAWPRQAQRAPPWQGGRPAMPARRLAQGGWRSPGPSPPCTCPARRPPAPSLLGRPAHARMGRAMWRWRHAAAPSLRALQAPSYAALRTNVDGKYGYMPRMPTCLGRRSVILQIAPLSADHARNMRYYFIQESEFAPRKRYAAAPRMLASWSPCSRPRCA